MSEIVESALRSSIEDTCEGTRQGKSLGLCGCLSVGGLSGNGIGAKDSADSLPLRLELQEARREIPSVVQILRNHARKMEHSDSLDQVDAACHHRAINGAIKIRTNACNADIHSASSTLCARLPPHRMATDEVSPLDQLLLRSI
jgi:hypothetical protein